MLEMHSEISWEWVTKVWYQEQEPISNKLTKQINVDFKTYKNFFKIQQSCLIPKAELGAHNMILWPAPGTASRGSPTSGQNCVDYLCEILSQPDQHKHTITTCDYLTPEKKNQRKQLCLDVCRCRNRTICFSTLQKTNTEIFFEGHVCARTKTETSDRRWYKEWTARFYVYHLVNLIQLLSINKLVDSRGRCDQILPPEINWFHDFVTLDHNHASMI